MDGKTSGKNSPSKGGTSAQSTRAPTPLDVSSTPEPLQGFSPSSAKQVKPATLGQEYRKQGADSKVPWITPDPILPIEEMSLTEFMSARARLFDSYWKIPASDSDSNDFLSHINAWKDSALEYLHEVDAQVEVDHPIHSQVQQVIQRFEKAYSDLFSARLPVRHGHDNMYVFSTLERVWRTRLPKLPMVPPEHKRYWLRDGYEHYIADPKLHAGYIDVKCAWILEPNDVTMLVQAVVFQNKRHQLHGLMALGTPEGALWYIHNSVDDRLWAVTSFDPANRSVSLHEKMGSVTENGIHTFYSDE